MSASEKKLLTLFEMGRCMATDGAIEKIGFAKCRELLTRHRDNDWGELCEDDTKLNEEALAYGNRIFSCYTVDDEKFYVITEADRSVTTVMLADEY
jgi:hypothetical protein